MQNKFLGILLILIITVSFGINQVEGFIEFKKYKVINSPKVCGDKMCSEIDERRAKKGLASHDIKVCGDKLCNDITNKKAKFAYKSNPFVQLGLGVPLDLIQCKEGLHLIIKTGILPACVKAENITKLKNREWAISEIEQIELFKEIIKKRENIDIPSKTIKNFDTILSITPNEISNQKYLMFNGDGWHRLHNVEITISEEKFTESLLTKTDDRGHLSMPWRIPDNIRGKIYHILATDGIHEFEMDIPIAS